MISFIRRLFRRRVVLQTYKVEKTKQKDAIDKKCKELARELGWPWPMRRAR